MDYTTFKTKFKESPEEKQLLSSQIAELDDQMSLIESAELTAKQAKAKIQEINQRKHVLEGKLEVLEQKTTDLIQKEAKPTSKIDVERYLSTVEKENLPPIQPKTEQITETELIQKVEKMAVEKSKVEKMMEKAIESQKKAVNLVNKKKGKDYTYMENQRKAKERLLKERQITVDNIEKVKLERKEFFKPINKAEIKQFEQKYLEEREKLILKREVDRIEESQNRGKIKVERSSSYMKASKSYAEEREKQERERLIKRYNQEKSKNYANILKLPKIDEKKRETREENIKKIKHQPVKQKRKTRPSFYPKKARKLVPIKKPEVNMRRSRSQGGSVMKKKDYLAEFRKKNVFENNKSREIDWSKLMRGKDKLGQIDRVKAQVESIEQKAKRKEELLAISGGIAEQPSVAEELTNMKLSAVKGKLAILNGIEEDDEVKESEEFPTEY